MTEEEMLIEITRLRSALRTVAALTDYANSVQRTSQPEIVGAIAHLLNSIPLGGEVTPDDRIFDTGFVPGDKEAIILKIDAQGLGVRVADMVKGEPFPFVLYGVDAQSIRNNADALLTVLDHEVQEKFLEYQIAEEEAAQERRSPPPDA